MKGYRLLLAILLVIVAVAAGITSAALTDAGNTHKHLADAFELIAFLTAIGAYFTWFNS
jgi:hypothetical protein